MYRRRHWNLRSLSITRYHFSTLFRVKSPRTLTPLKSNHHWPSSQQSVVELSIDVTGGRHCSKQILACCQSYSNFEQSFQIGGRTSKCLNHCSLSMHMPSLLSATPTPTLRLFGDQITSVRFDILRHVKFGRDSLESLARSSSLTNSD